MCSYPLDQIANDHGGWARLCDPEFKLSEELYAEFAAQGCSRKRLDEIRSREAMPAKQRILLDVSDELLRAWSRYLAITPRHQAGGPMPRKRFVEVPVDYFWDKRRQILSEHSLSQDDIEVFIESTGAAEGVPGDPSPYYSNRLAQIVSLARLCRDYPPPAGKGGLPPDDTGPDLDPSRVPVGTSPYAGGATVALPLPEPAKEDKET